MQAVIVDPSATGGVALADVAEPIPLPSDAVVSVAACSLNLGEVRRARAAAKGWRPGWDIAGVIERSALDGSGPPLGARVVGMVGEGAWAERVAIPTASLAVLPQNVNFERASTLPVAGLTALYALGKRGALLGRSVLVTGASGGVGVFALQLARLSGAHVTALVHREERRAAVAAYAHDVIVGSVIPAGSTYDLILESVGGDVFASALRALAPDGVVVVYGTSADRASTIEVAPFYARGGCSIYGFYLFHELLAQPTGPGLARLAALLDEGALDVHIDDVLHVAQIGTAVARLWNREVTGKIVLTW